MKERYKTIVAAYLILRSEKGVLLLQRCNSGYCDGQYSLPAGHVEEGEPVIETMVREAREEVGLDVRAENLALVHVGDRNANDGHRLDLFFECSNWKGEPRNIEPEKCSDMRWVEDLDELPEIIPYIKEVLDHVSVGTVYSLEDWS